MSSANFISINQLPFEQFVGTHNQQFFFMIIKSSFFLSCLQYFLSPNLTFFKVVRKLIAKRQSLFFRTKQIKLIHGTIVETLAENSANFLSTSTKPKFISVVHHFRIKKQERYIDFRVEIPCLFCLSSNSVSLILFHFSISRSFKKKV